MSTHNLLTIAGTDPSGGAGIQADLKTFAAHSCYGASVITALTAQNTLGVQSVHPVPREFVQQQLTSVLDDVKVDGIKTGMLFDAHVIGGVVETLKAYLNPEAEGGDETANPCLAPIIVDPVCASTSGHTLLQPDALDALIDELFPLATLITPNKSEAELLLRQRNLLADGASIQTLDDMFEAANRLCGLVPQRPYAVLLKGGHLTTSLSLISSFLASHSEVKLIKQNLYDENMEILQVGLPKNELGTGEQPLVVDLLFKPTGETIVFARPRIESNSTHGTGCTLAASIACGVARGLDLEQAVHAASLYTHDAIISARKIGHGFGPLEHLHSLRGPHTPHRQNPLNTSNPPPSRTKNADMKAIAITVPPRSPANPYPFTHYLITSTLPAWKAYVEHDFVTQLGKGILAKEKFVRFIKQDYHYLKYYARAYALLAAKASTFPAIHAATNIILSVIHEINTHKAFCGTFGVTEEELEECEEEVGCTAYGAYIINVGLQGDTARLTMALMSCLLGYGEVGLWLRRHALSPGEEPTEAKWVIMEGNPYRQWIEDYSGEAYQGAVKAGLETIEALIIDDPPSPKRLKEWRDVWERCTNLERGFWDMAMAA